MARHAAADRLRVRTPHHVRPGYMRVTWYVPTVLRDAVRIEAGRQHRTPSGEVCRALKRWLGWDEDEGGP